MSNLTIDPDDVIVTGRKFEDPAGWFLFEDFGAKDTFSFLGMQAFPFQTDYVAVPVPDHGNGLTVDQGKNALQALAEMKSALQDIINRYGPGTKLDLDGRLVPALQVLEGIETLSAWIEAGILVWGLSTGDLNALDAVAFVFGVIVGAATSEATGSALLAFAVGNAADMLVLSGMKNLKVHYDNAVETVNTHIENFVEENPVPGYAGNPVQMYRTMLGLPPGGGLPGDTNVDQ